jgi:hypothetical protein
LINEREHDSPNYRNIEMTGVAVAGSVILRMAVAET